MTQHGRPGTRARRRRRRTATFLVAASVVGVGAWQAWGPATRALGLEGLGLEAVAGGVPRAEPSPTPTALDPDLARRFADAQEAAAADGVSLTLTSGWRSADEQQVLVDEAVATYGSVEEARRWVLPPDRSAHVAGLAIDVGPMAGALWLGERAAQFGLCRTYDNEWWHFEPMPADGVCPTPHPDSSWGWS